MAKSKNESKGSNMETPKAPVIAVEDETAALKEVEEVKEVEVINTKSKSDHSCGDNYRTISVGGKPTKQCRVCGVRF